MVSDVTALLA